MPFYKKTLRDLIKAGISNEKALRYFSQILNGVEAAHIKGHWHRDLKPENILYDEPKDTLIVADWGIAHFKEDELHTTVATKPQERLANFMYAAPEQKIKGATVNHRADIFALGMLLNEIFTNVVPIGSGYKTIKSVNDAYTYLDDLVELMIKNSVNDRPQSIDVVKQQLIARESDFINRQKISRLTQTVIPHSELDDPLVNDPVRLVDKDYNKDQLILIMSQTVNDKWINAFKTIGNYSSIVGKEPYAYSFQENRAMIQADEHEVRQIIQDFKDYLVKANEEYKSRLLADKRKEEEELKKERQQQIVEEEKRQRILKSVEV
jgi:serine/threonine protein kinase